MTHCCGSILVLQIERPALLHTVLEISQHILGHRYTDILQNIFSIACTRKAHSIVMSFYMQKVSSLPYQLPASSGGVCIWYQSLQPHQSASYHQDWWMSGLLPHPTASWSFEDSPWQTLRGEVSNLLCHVHSSLHHIPGEYVPAQQYYQCSTRDGGGMRGRGREKMWDEEMFGDSGVLIKNIFNNTGNLIANICNVVQQLVWLCVHWRGLTAQHYV